VVEESACEGDALYNWFLPIGLRLQKPLAFRPGLVEDPEVDEIIAVSSAEAKARHDGRNVDTPSERDGAVGIHVQPSWHHLVVKADLFWRSDGRRCDPDRSSELPFSDRAPPRANRELARPRLELGVRDQRRRRGLADLELGPEVNVL